jgi:hypothetical protein
MLLRFCERKNREHSQGYLPASRVDCSWLRILELHPLLNGIRVDALGIVRGAKWCSSGALDFDHSDGTNQWFGSLAPRGIFGTFGSSHEATAIHNPVNECKRLWLLKNSLPRNSQI